MAGVRRSGLVSIWSGARSPAEAAWRGSQRQFGSCPGSQMGFSGGSSGGAAGAAEWFER